VASRREDPPAQLPTILGSRSLDRRGADPLNEFPSTPHRTTAARGPVNQANDRRAPAQLGAATGTAVMWRAVQHGGVRIISLLRFLVLARILAPEDFGLLAIAIVSVDLLLSLTDFGMIPALVQRDRVEQRHYDVAWTVNLVRAVAVAGIVFAAAPLLAAVFGEPRTTPLIQALALRPVLDAAGSIRMADLTRTLRFRAITAVRLSATLVETVVAVVFAPQLGVWALVLGALAGTAAGSALSYSVAPYRPRLSFDRSAARPLFQFGQWMFVAGILAIMGDALLRAVISRQLGTADLGLYYVAFRVAMLPHEVLSDLVGSVAFPIHALLQGDPPRAARVFRSTLRSALALLMLVYAILVAVADSVVLHVLGPPWQGAAPVIRLIAVVGVIGAIFDATTAMLRGLGRPQWVAALFAVHLPIVSTLAWWLAARYGVAGAALALLGAEVAVQVTAAVFATRLLPNAFAGLARPLAAIGVSAGAGATSAFAMDVLLPGIQGLVAGSVSGLVVATAALVILDRRFALGLVADALVAFPAVAARLPVVFR
jgi:lipopolysaccharide exporter